MPSSKKKGIASTAGLNKRKTPSNSTPDNRKRKTPSNTTDDDDFFAAPANDDEDDWDGTSTGSRSSKKPEKGSSRATSEESFKAKRKPRRKRKVVPSDSEEDEGGDPHGKTEFMKTFKAFEYQQPDLETGRPLSKKRARVAGHVVGPVKEEKREGVRAKKFKKDYESRNAQKAAGDWMSSKMTGSKKSTPTADKPICDISAHPRAQEQLKAADPTQSFAVTRPINLSSKAHVTKERDSMLKLHRALASDKEYFNKGKSSQYFASLKRYIDLLAGLHAVLAQTPKGEAQMQEEDKAPSHGASAPIAELEEAIKKASPKTLKRMLEKLSDGRSGAMEALNEDAEDEAACGCHEAHVQVE